MLCNIIIYKNNLGFEELLKMKTKSAGKYKRALQEASSSANLRERYLFIF